MIGNKELPKNKNIRVALSYIYGIGKKFGPTSPSRKILEESNINPFTKVRDLTSEQVDLIRWGVKKFSTGEELEEEVEKNIDTQISLGTYQGSRRSRKPNPLPIHGQRTRHNARTAKAGAAKLKPGEKRKRVAVAGKKKAPTPK